MEKNSEMIRWHLRQGAGKMDHEFGRFSQVRPRDSAQHVYLISGDEITRGDYSRLRDTYNSDRPAAVLREQLGRVLFAVHDHETTDELHEQPEVRDYFAGIYRDWPALMAFAHLRSHCLRWIVACTVKSSRSIRTERNCHVYVPRREVAEFFIHSFKMAHAFYTLAGCLPPEGKNRLKRIAQNLNIL